MGRAAARPCFYIKSVTIIKCAINALSGSKITTNDLLSRITIDPEIAQGKPVIRGLRYPVQNILELLSAGMTFEEILEDYPDLERDDLLAISIYQYK